MKGIFKKLFILLPNIQMPTTTNTLNSFNSNVVTDDNKVEVVDTKKNRKKWLWLVSLALLSTLLFGKVADWYAQEVVAQEWNDNNKELPIEVHGSIRAWSNVTPLLWSVLSDTPAVRITIDASNPEKWYWISYIRFDDFNKSKNYLASQYDMVDLYKKIKQWKVSITWVLEYGHADKIKDSHSLTLIWGLDYDAWNLWDIDAWGCYTIQNGKNVAAFRAWFTKTINDACSIAAHVILNDKTLSWRAQVVVKLWNWFEVESGCIVSGWEVTRTGWLHYGF